MDPFWLTVILIGVTCFISAANLALRHLSRAKIIEIAERQDRGHRADAIVRHLSELTLMTSTVRMAVNLMLVLVIVHMFRDRQDQPVVYYGSIFLASVLLVLVFGVAIPNGWAKYAGEPLLVASAPLLNVLRVVFHPVVAFLRLFEVLVQRLAGVPFTDGQADAEQMEQEILTVVSEGEAQGAVDEEEKEMIESVMELDEMQVGQIMTPRTEILALPSTATLFEAKDLIAREGHSRMPVYDESIDNILGVLYAKDLLNFERTDDFDATRVMRKVPFVPETKPIRDLLREFRTNKVHIAVVLDEYGGTAGLVTIEDIMEELVGEITDEFEPPAPETMKRLDADTVEADARVHVKELNDELGIALPEDEDYDTIAGFVCSALGRIPSAGEEMHHGNVHIRILDAEARKINRLRIHVVREQEPAEAKEA
jgi:putative hemolysin